MGRDDSTDNENPKDNEDSKVTESASDSPKGGRPGPVDGGGGGGMATRENAPEIADDSA